MAVNSAGVVRMYAAAGRSRSLETPLLHVQVLEYGEHPSLLGRTFTISLLVLLVLETISVFLRTLTVGVISCELPTTVYEVFELTTPKLRALYAEDEGYGVHEIGLARAIGTDDRREIAKWAYYLVTSVVRKLVCTL
jgi:hypothetical protein